MRRGRTLILLALILLVGALAAFLLLSRISTTPGGDGPAAQPTPQLEAQIVIAAQDISRGSEIPADAVVLTPFIADMVVETMVTDLTLVIGRRARMDIARGVPITENMVTEQVGDLLGTGSDAALAIPPGFTAIPIPMNRLSGVAYALRPGDAVDVLVTMLMVDVDPDFQTVLPNDIGIFVAPDGSLLGAVGGRNVEVERDSGKIIISDPEPPAAGRLDTEENSGQSIYVLPSEDQRPRLVTQRIIGNATVLHVGTFPLEEEEEEVAVGAEAPVAVQQPEGQPAQPAAPPPEIPAPDIVTLVVPPQDALTINWAIKAGLDLVLTLRGPRDATEIQTASVTLQYLIDNYNITIPGKPAFGIVPRIDEPIIPQLPGDTPEEETAQ